MALLDYSSFYLVGIKGVAMTALAQCLLDAGKKVAGSDVEEAFVTQPILDRLALHLDHNFSEPIPADADCVIYTAAHQGVNNPQVVVAKSLSLPTFSHAEALGDLFNQKKGISVCGVGGKSTTSAMVTWILEKTGRQPSFAVGVGNIPGIELTGAWRTNTDVFVAEADEYAANPTAVHEGAEIIPRFSFLKPEVCICTNLQFDHPDVYRDFEHTKAVYRAFFSNLKPEGHLIYNADDQELKLLSELVQADRSDIHVHSFGERSEAQCQLLSYDSTAGKTISRFRWGAQEYALELQIPGRFNATNALAAIVAASTAGVPIEDSIKVLASFRSTMRRVEFVGEKAGVRYYDDYAHHPTEIKHVIKAFREWYPTQRLVVAFQSHTYTRTRALFPEFAAAFEDASEVVMIDIFSSAREKYDETVSSAMLCQAIHAHYPSIAAQTLPSISELATYLRSNLKPGDVCLTVGAGDMYQVHELL